MAYSPPPPLTPPLNAPASMPLLSSSLCVPCNIQSKAFSQSPNIRGIHKKEGTITLFNEWSADYSETLHLYKTSSFTFCLLFGSLTTQNKTLGLGNQPDVNTFAPLCLLLLACFIHVINPSRILKWKVFFDFLACSPLLKTPQHTGFTKLPAASFEHNWAKLGQNWWS